MLKDMIRDYATAAFKFYDEFKKNNNIYGTEQNSSDAFHSIKKGKRQRGSSVEHLVLKYMDEPENKAESKDVSAVEKTISWLSDNGYIDVVKCIKMVYFGNGEKPFRRGEMTLTVRHVSNNLYISEREVYRNLKFARQVFCIIRGLRI